MPRSGYAPRVEETASDAAIGRALETIYRECHAPALIDPDPLLVVRDYADIRDREIAGLFCASFALGRASAIVDACRRALAPFGPHLRQSLTAVSDSELERMLGGFVYRFFKGRDAAGLLSAAAGVSNRFGSLEAAFTADAETPPRSYADAESGTLLSRCDSFVDRLLSEAVSRVGRIPLARNLLSAPRDGSACKRLMLFLRWMVRADAVDPGGWSTVRPKELIVPLDVHLHRISRTLGLCSRSSADLRSAIEVTRALRRFDPDDPIRYDFALARLGIRSDYSLKMYFCP